MMYFFIYVAHFHHEYFIKPSEDPTFRVDRLNTKMSFENDSVVFSVNKVSFFKDDVNSHRPYGLRLHTYNDKKSPRHISFSYEKDRDNLVWYLDKNRPLPKGKLYDPYRQVDYERRKKEGFKKPLFKLKFSTPELTKEQQEERKRTGKW